MRRESHLSLPRLIKLVFATANICVLCANCNASAHSVAEPSPAQPPIAIEGVAVVEVIRGEISSPRTVLLQNGTITEVGAPDSIAIPRDAVRVDGRDKYLIPGLVDMHVHLFNNTTHRPPNDWMFPLFVANGVTAVREMAAVRADMPTVAGWRAAVDRAEVIAPDVLAAGIIARADSTEPAWAQVQNAQRAGAEFIKIFSDMPEQRWRALIAAARGVKIPVCGHVPVAVGLLEAAAAGQRSVEHLMQVFEACSRIETRAIEARRGLRGKEALVVRDRQEREVLESFDQHICDQTAATLATTQQAQVPTLVLSHFEGRASRRDYHRDERWRGLRPDEQTRWERALDARTPQEKNLAELRLGVARNIVRTLNRAGVRTLAGTDTPTPLIYPGFSLHTELELLVEAGMTSADALRAATIWPAEFSGIAESTGSISVGKRADLVLLDDNPLANISNTQRINAVVLRGRLLQRAELDQLLSR